MIHARDDYNRIQDPEGKIPDDEPVMLFRAQDKCFIPLLNAYADMLKLCGATPRMIDSVHRHIGRAADWQTEHRPKIPDLPK